MLNVESIQNGIVIDHITAGKGLEIYKFLHLENISRSIALLQYVKSEKYGKKDLIKIEGSDTLPQLDILGYLDDKITLIDPNITVNIIRNGVRVEKKHLELPKKLVNVIHCKNPRCITNLEANCEHIFRMSSSKKYRCIYCNQEIITRQ